MEAAGYLIPATAELAACMEDRKDHFHRGLSGFFLGIHRDPSPVIDDGDRLVCIDGHINTVAKSSQSFVYCIVYDLVYQMMQTAQGCAPDIHARSFPDCLQPL